MTFRASCRVGPMMPTKCARAGSRRTTAPGRSSFGWTWACIQMEIQGRPDGPRPRGVPSLLDFYIEEENRAPSHTLSTPLDFDACAELQQEVMQYYYRIMAFHALGDFDGVVARQRPQPGSDRHRFGIRGGRRGGVAVHAAVSLHAHDECPRESRTEHAGRAGFPRRSRSSGRPWRIWKTFLRRTTSRRTRMARRCRRRRSWNR